MSRIKARPMRDLFDQPPAPPTPPARKVYRVAELTRRIKAILEDEIGSVWVEGEVSNFKRSPAGHLYFTLKDESAQLRAVFFRGAAAGCKVDIRDGVLLRALGSFSVYEPRGEYQLMVRRVEDAGQGNLQQAFERLKAKLESEGLFDAARKRPLPILPRRIGLITSPTGAVIRDMLHVFGRRFPNLHLLLAPVRVQGAGAAQEIAAALDTLNARGGLDLLIVARGGGSLEDLWAFNEEVVARAIARSNLPVISAVGHETDFTISDFVADLRAPTPSAAAELAIRPLSDWLGDLAALTNRLASALHRNSLSLRNRLTRAAGSYVFREPSHLLLRHRERVRQLQQRARRELRGTFERDQQRLDELRLRLERGARLACERRGQRLLNAQTRLRTLNPQGVLDRGFSITLDEAGHVVLDATTLAPGRRITARLARGSLAATVTTVQRKEDHAPRQEISPG